MLGLKLNHVSKRGHWNFSPYEKWIELMQTLWDEVTHKWCINVSAILIIIGAGNGLLPVQLKSTTRINVYIMSIGGENCKDFLQENINFHMTKCFRKLHLHNTGNSFGLNVLYNTCCWNPIICNCTISRGCYVYQICAVVGCQYT